MLEIGSLVDGKYKILRVVGKGGMSVVYQAVNEKANKIWAIKEVRKDGVQNFEVVKQNLIVETELLKRFNHPNLPSIIDVIDGEGSFLIVMDYIEGNSLNKAIETSGAQSQEDVIEWSKQLCDVLGYLHSRKPPIIYRDMKPANVMLKPDGNVSLIDFGTAREFKSSSVEDTTCLGTQGYAAPEQYGGHGQTDARTDIYCLGATMYHLVTGHNPSTPPYEMYPIRQWNPVLSSGLEEIIIKCTQRNPNDRYQSCAELLYALDHYQDLDIENKKVQNLKWKTFMVSLILALVMAVGAVGFKIAANAETASTYDSLIKQAENSAGVGDYEAGLKYYEEAIELEPDNMVAYNGMLNMYMSDEVIETEEYKEINAVVGKNENLLTTNVDEFADFAKEVADSLFFCSDYDPNAGIAYSANWYKKVYENATNEADKKNAEYMMNFAKNYNNIGTLDKKGNEVIDVETYFETLSNLVNEDFGDGTNIVVPLKCYEFVASQLYIRNDWLYKNSISELEYNALLDEIEAKVLAIESSDTYLKNKDSNRNLAEYVANAKAQVVKAREIGYGQPSASSNEGVGG
ncbi:MAG: serine/threonine protein kinase [Ruminococcus sp.]|nr:serine/threonine protein kinase [Ruminococcus sp.]